ncbi:class I SAM-dependent methyltransferase [Clostridium estertheticum]|uniref:Methyltransferase n=1 Tax=Clostridium estertheticum subsp. estertheticum TaxID=1552 RepID=A0A1J0GK30_9CLOT|nr:methyltransferase [Clostridium estertheticum]APC41230.1 methyltransferase [Clostridium estertheticum subsp. estertheticum]MBZ9616943.1 methyltransferase [Clostridium estertheticum subsp. laramiense]WAG72645.1 methyltransferase [Clostridium estertheticum]
MLNVNVKNIDMKFNTSNEVFAPRNVDKGTLAMLSIIEFKNDDKVLDLGCGYGIVGILSAKIVGATNVVMADIDSRAVELTRGNIDLNNVKGIEVYQSDGFKNINEKDLTLIISNPPYHADFSVPKEFIEKGFNRLAIGGRIYMVTKRKDWYKNKLVSIFGGVKITEIDSYYIFMAEKRTTTYSSKKKLKLRR